MGEKDVPTNKWNNKSFGVRTQVTFESALSYVYVQIKSYLWRCTIKCFEFRTKVTFEGALYNDLSSELKLPLKVHYLMV